MDNLSGGISTRSIRGLQTVTFLKYRVQFCPTFSCRRLGFNKPLCDRDVIRCSSFRLVDDSPMRLVAVK